MIPFYASWACFEVNHSFADVLRTPTKTCGVLQFGTFFHVFIGSSVIKGLKMLFFMFNQSYHIIDHGYAIGADIYVYLVVACLNAIALFLCTNLVTGSCIN
jgi:hypothetical protein